MQLDFPPILSPVCQSSTLLVFSSGHFSFRQAWIEFYWHMSLFQLLAPIYHRFWSCGNIIQYNAPLHVCAMNGLSWYMSDQHNKDVSSPVLGAEKSRNKVNSLTQLLTSHMVGLHSCLNTVDDSWTCSWRTTGNWCRTDRRVVGYSLGRHVLQVVHVVLLSPGCHCIARHRWWWGRGWGWCRLGMRVFTAIAVDADEMVRPNLSMRAIDALT